MTYSSALLHSAPLEPLAPSDSSSPDPFSESDNSVSGVVVSVPAVAVAVLSPAASALSLFSRASLQSIPVCSHHLWGACVPPPSFRPLTEIQNRPHCNELRDRILSPEDQCPRPHDPCVLYCYRQGGVLPLPVPPSAWGSPRQEPSDPALEGVQGRFQFPRQNPGLRPKEEDLLCHGDVEHP